MKNWLLLSIMAQAAALSNVATSSEDARGSERIGFEAAQRSRQSELKQSRILHKCGNARQRSDFQARELRREPAVKRRGSAPARR